MLFIKFILINIFNTFVNKKKYININIILLYIIFSILYEIQNLNIKLINKLK